MHRKEGGCGVPHCQRNKPTEDARHAGGDTWSCVLLQNCDNIYGLKEALGATDAWCLVRGANDTYVLARIGSGMAEEQTS
jgi:hypothetical protein